MISWFQAFASECDLCRHAPVSQWKREFVRKMNDAANKEASKEAAANHEAEARSEAGDAMGLTYGRGNDKLR